MTNVVLSMYSQQEDFTVNISEEVVGILLLISVIVTLLNIMLFFKVWGMTNDTKRIKDILQEWLDIEHPAVEDEELENRSKAS